MKYTVIIACMLMLITDVTNATGISKKITHKEALKLAVLAHGGSTKYIEDFFYDESVFCPPLYCYRGISSAPGAQGSFGVFAVNPWTGDVWDQDDCHKISTPASLKMQAKIRKRFTPAEIKQYKHLSNLKPECVVDDSEK